MSNDSTTPAWQKMMDDWQAQQSTMTQNMFAQFQQWSDAVKTSSTENKMPPFDTFYNTMSESLKQYYENNLSQESIPYWGQPEDFKKTETLFKQIQSLTQESITIFQKMSEGAAEALNEETQQYYLNTFTEMSNPSHWLKQSGDVFDMSAYKLSEGPFFSGVSDIDQRMANVSDSWTDLLKQSKSHQYIVFESWAKAYHQFLETLKAFDKEEKSLSPRELIDLWGKIANTELLSLHRSDAFLSSQKDVIRASMQHRLYEKNMAEVICEAMHIPTRAEVDDLHQSVTKLKRELRKTKTTLAQVLNKIESSSVPEKKVSAKKIVASKKVEPKKVAAKKTNIPKTTTKDE